MIYNILNIGRTGLKGMQNDLDNTAHNIANANTEGYKKKNTSFQELVNNRTSKNEVILANDLDLSINAGVKNGVHTVNHKQGSIYPTQGKYHLAIEGSGFFGVRNEKNELILTRNGSFHMDEEGVISNDSGYKLDLTTRVASGQWGNEDISISTDGEISSLENGVKRILGQVLLYNPEDLGAILPIDETSFFVPANVNLNNSANNPEDFGIMVQGYLEGSNVDMADSMVDMITTQRAYSMNAKAVQTIDDIMVMINGLKR